MGSVTTVTKLITPINSKISGKIDSFFRQSAAAQIESRQPSNLNYRLILRICCETVETDGAAR